MLATKGPLAPTTSLMKVFTSVLGPLWPATALHVNTKSSLLPHPRRVLRSLCFRCALVLLVFLLLLLLLFSRAMLLEGQPGESFHLTPAAATGEMDRHTDRRELNRRLPVLLKDVTPHSDGRNIFQIVTSSANTLNGRHYCSIESFCKHNPNTVVWLLFLGQTVLVGEPLRVLIQLEQSYPNLKVAKLELWTAVKGTPLQDIITSGQLRRSKYPANHLSDVLRLSVIYKSGGLYTDFDFICWSSVEDARNTLALAVPDRLMNGLFHFEAHHPFLHLLLEDVSKHFDGSLWGHNGPLLFTRAAKKYCPQFQYLGDFSSQETSFDISALLMNVASLFTGTDSHKPGHPLSYSRLKFPISSSNVLPNSGKEREKAGLETACDRVSVLDPTEFMPISQTDIDKAFGENSTTSFAEALGAARGLHLFNRLTGKWPVPEGSAVGQVMARHCQATLGAARRLGLQL